MGDQRRRVLMANNYPLVAAERRWREGDYPAHHQWGAVPLRNAGYDVEFLPMSRNGRVGDVRAQLRALVTPGVLLALREIADRPGLTVGLEHFLPLD